MRDPSSSSSPVRVRTIVKTAFRAHKCRTAILAVATALLVARPITAQERPFLTTGQVGTMLVSSAVYMVGSVVDLHSAPTCAPCDRAGVPAFDRWAIHSPVPSLARASDALVVGMAAAVLVGAEGNRSSATVTAEGAAWALATTAVAKEVIGRLRPIMYTDQAGDHVLDHESQRSLPSGHAAAAAAMAVGYWLNNPGHPRIPKYVLAIGAVGVGVLRVASGKHFPSDVVAGAAVGAGAAIVAHAIRF